MVFEYVFRVLSSLLNQEPEHIELLWRRKNLLDILKYALIKIGKSQMMGPSVVEELKNVLKNCIVTQVFVERHHKVPLHQLSPH